MPYAMLSDDPDREPECAFLWTLLAAFYAYVVFTSYTGSYFWDESHPAVCAVSDDGMCTVRAGECAGAFIPCGADVDQVLHSPHTGDFPKFVTCYTLGDTCAVTRTVPIRADMTHASGVAGGTAAGFSPMVALLSICLLGSVTRDIFSRSLLWALEWAYIRLAVLACVVLPLLAWGIRLRIAMVETARVDSLATQPVTSCLITTLGTDVGGAVNLLGPYFDAAPDAACDTVKLYIPTLPAPHVGSTVPCRVAADCSDADFASYEFTEHERVVLWTVCIVAYSVAVLIWSAIGLRLIKCGDAPPESHERLDTSLRVAGGEEMQSMVEKGGEVEPDLVEPLFIPPPPLGRPAQPADSAEDAPEGGSETASVVVE